MRHKQKSRAGLTILLLLSTLPTQSQRLERLPDYFRDDRIPKCGEFTFARRMYTDSGWGQGWTTDYPKADYQLLLGLRGWVKSLLSISREPVQISLLDPRLFTLPFIYCVEPGQLELSDAEATNLREYLDRGGFLMLDDFWGVYEQQHVQIQIKKYFRSTTFRKYHLPTRFSTVIMTSIRLCRFPMARTGFTVTGLMKRVESFLIMKQSPCPMALFQF